MGYFAKTLKGTTWIGGFRVASRLVAFVKLGIIARILTPAEFGTFGIAALVLAFLEIFTETGINTILIQEKKNIDRYINTAWVISIVRGVLIALILLLSSSFIAAFFNSPDSYPLLILISIVPLIRAFINPSVVKFQKDLTFHKEFWYKFTTFFVDAVVAVVVTVVTQSAVGVIWGFVAGAMWELVVSFIVARPLPRLVFHKGLFSYIVHKGKWVTTTGIFQYLFRQSDDIIVGKILGEGALGIYQSAYKISTLPVSEVADVVGKVTFPVYVKIADDMKRLRKAFLKTLAVSTIAALGIGVVLYLLADYVVLILLGNAWLEAVPVLRVLVIFGVTKAITASFHSLFLALEKQESVTKLTGVSTLVLFLVIFPLVSKYGVVGAGYAAILGSIAALPFTWYYFVQLFPHKS